MQEQPMDEHLATVRLKDGSAVKFVREGKGLRIEAPDYKVSLPRATGQQAFSLFSLLESIGESVEYPEDEEDA
mgnify:FL=1